jgi:hypothetical protein
MKKTEETEVVLDLSWAEVAKAAFVAKGIENGLWRVALKMSFAATQHVWMEADKSARVLPTGTVGVEGIALISVKEPGPLVFDAASMGISAAKSTKRAASRKGAKAPDA